jgi:hypothetical protein
MQKVAVIPVFLSGTEFKRIEYRRFNHAVNIAVSEGQTLDADVASVAGWFAFRG